jgi:hypothetical protein
MASRSRKGRVPALTGFSSLSKTEQHEITKVGRKVFERHRADLEQKHRGMYVLIDIKAEELFLAESPQEAYRKAEARHARGPFHLIRIGDRAAFRSRRSPNGDDTRLAR